MGGIPRACDRAANAPIFISISPGSCYPSLADGQELNAGSTLHQLKGKQSMTSVFIQSLEDYNAGRIVGEWVDVEGMDESELQDAINKILAKSKEEVAEEWEFAGYEGFYTLNLCGYSSIKTVITLATAINEHGEAYAIYADYVGLRYATTEGFEDSYYGAWDSFKDFAENLFDECYLSQVPESVRFYIDYDAFARDLEIDYFHDRGSDGQTHVFSCH